MATMQARKRWADKNPEYQHDYYLANKKQIADNAKQWRKDNVVSYLYSTAKYRAKLNGIEFSITKESVEIPECCPILGIKLEPVGEDKSNSPSLDRVDNNKGYIPGNVRVISWRANKLKSNASIEEIEALYNYVKGNL